MTSYADDFKLLAFAPSIVEANARANQLCSTLMRWTEGKELAIYPQKSSVTLFTSDTHQSWFHPQVYISDEVVPLNRTPKILGVTHDTHFTFGPRTHDCVERASMALNVMKPSLGRVGVSRQKTLWVATYKATVRLILNYAPPPSGSPNYHTPPGLTGGDPEQGSEDCDRMPPKGLGELKLRVLPIENAPTTLFPPILC